MISKGCTSHLVRVRNLECEPAPLQSILMVNEFPGVFLEDPPRIPQEKEIDFAINLLTSTQLISIPPYRMAQAELRQFKEQLKDFIEKVFIHDSISPWGAPVLFVIVFIDNIFIYLRSKVEHAYHLRVVLQTAGSYVVC